MARAKRPTCSPEPPAHLSAEGSAWFRALRDQYDILDEGGLLLLRNALEAFDRTSEARECLKRDGLVVKDKYGQVRANPAASIEASSRKLMLAALRQLNLDVEPLRDKPGRPPGGGR